MILLVASRWLPHHCGLCFMARGRAVIHCIIQPASAYCVVYNKLVGVVTTPGSMNMSQGRLLHTYTLLYHKVDYCILTPCYVTGPNEYDCFPMSSKLQALMKSAQESHPEWRLNTYALRLAAQETRSVSRRYNNMCLLHNGVLPYFKLYVQSAFVITCLFISRLSITWIITRSIMAPENVATSKIIIVATRIFFI